MKHSEGFLRLIDEAKKGVVEVSVEKVKARVDGGERFTLIDVREDNEWSAGHIRGAKHFGRGILERDIEVAVPERDAEIVLYCGGGFRSILAAESLKRMGYTHAVSMAGGWREWTEAGGATEK